jgi:hypothetical protein
MRALCLLFSSLLFFVAACGNANEGTRAAQGESERPAVLDLKRGSFDGVGLGDTTQEMRRSFGAGDLAFPALLPGAPVRDGLSHASTVR